MSKGHRRFYRHWTSGDRLVPSARGIIYTVIPLYSYLLSVQKVSASVKAYREYILGASVERFSVASNFLLHAAPSCDLQNMADDLDNVAEAELLRTAVHIDDIERPSVFLRNLVNNARG